MPALEHHHFRAARIQAVQFLRGYPPRGAHPLRIATATMVHSRTSKSYKLVEGQRVSILRACCSTCPSIAPNSGARKKRSPPLSEKTPLPPTSIPPSGENIRPVSVLPNCRMVSSSCCEVTFQNFTVLSSLDVARVLPSGEKATERTPCLCPMHVPSSLPEVVFHSRMASSWLAMARTLPSAEKADANANPPNGPNPPVGTPAGCSSDSSFAIGFKVAASQIWTVSPRPWLASSRPSGEKKTLKASAAHTMLVPPGRSHRRRVRSPRSRPRVLSVMSVFPSGDNTTRSTPPSATLRVEASRVTVSQSRTTPLSALWAMVRKSSLNEIADGPNGPGLPCRHSRSNC